MDFMTRSNIFEQKKVQKIEKLKNDFYGSYERKKSKDDSKIHHRSMEQIVERLHKHQRSTSRERNDS
jgi:hypothetical protein